jgi:hypothetical protein
MVVLVLLWGDDSVESFLVVLHHQGALSAGLLNSLKKQEVCERLINARRDVNVKRLFVRKKFSEQHGSKLQ